MKSTRAFLNNRFKPSDKSNHERQCDISVSLDKTIDMPDHWLDKITEELLNQPCNLKLRPGADDYYIDKKLMDEKLIEFHPLLTGTRLHPDSYVVDKKLARNINASLTVEEIKQYVRNTEQARRILNAILPSDITDDDDIRALEPLHGRDILKKYAGCPLPIPAQLLSALSQTIMTLPVKLNGGHIIDFFELLIAQPVVESNEPANPTEYKIRGYLHPFDADQLLESIEIDYALLAQLDSFLEKVRLHQRLQPIYEKVATYKELIKIAVPQHAKKSFMQILADNHFPLDQIPSELLVSIEPGTSYTRIATDPVIVDDSYPTDFHELIKFWEINGWGINPSTLKPINSICYNNELKEALNHFVLNNGKNVNEIIADKQTLIIVSDKSNTARLRSQSLFAPSTQQELDQRPASPERKASI